MRQQLDADLLFYIDESAIYSLTKRFLITE
jgi:hypothetical protein